MMKQEEKKNKDNEESKVRQKLKNVFSDEDKNQQAPDDPFSKLISTW